MVDPAAAPASSAPNPVPEPPWWRPAKRNTTRRQPLSRDAIVDAAVRVVDAEGVDALTLRRLGQELATGPATLYWHISGKDELGELVYDRIMGEVELPALDAAQWQEQLKEIGRRTYRVLLRHNDVARLSLGRVGVGPNMLAIMEWMLALLRGAGFPDQTAGYVGDLLGRYLDASVLEVRLAPGGAGDDPRAWWQMVHQHLSSLPSDRFPNLVASVATAYVADEDERFEFGLDVLVRGLESSLASRP